MLLTVTPSFGSKMRPRSDGPTMVWPSRRRTIARSFPGPALGPRHHFGDHRVGKGGDRAPQELGDRRLVERRNREHLDLRRDRNEPRLGRREHQLGARLARVRELGHDRLDRAARSRRPARSLRRAVLPASSISSAPATSAVIAGSNPGHRAAGHAERPREPPQQRRLAGRRRPFDDQNALFGQALDAREKLGRDRIDADDRPRCIGARKALAGQRARAALRSSVASSSALGNRADGFCAIARRDTFSSA